MIDVGKVVTRAAHSGPYESEPEESISVNMSEHAVHLGVNGKNYKGLTPEQAIELGQLLLKSAEVQSEYATEAKRLDEETKQLATKYKDMVSGLGLEREVDLVDARGTFKVIEAG